MNFDPRLGTIDRVANVAAGAALLAYAIFGDFERTWLRAVFVALGAVLAVGGLYGT